ncbi:hypothetical protein ADL22_23050 [Streptomyces sp. NRRL F-4489]|uniref:hypothetical protein n=1 Tax=Streptomyces sp. NRRL F-4489 TaxID=1609095 RepID=UPI00074B1BC8|nr:hypothetical protein [Streptomyces sp. NRRL F-4489]KUL36999.1 hypothetical protein ADL22_23050 [Streptomyces sp. NRRL F-4489]
MTHTLVERAPESAVRPALIQNGNDPKHYSHSGVSLVERAPESAVRPALIQNGNDPKHYSHSGASI